MKTATGQSVISRTTTYTYAETGYANPHPVTSVGGTSYTYDNNGNVTAIGSLDYTWDWRNRLATAERSGGGITTYGYDHTGQRVFQATGSATTSYPNRYYSVASSSLTATTTKHIFSPDGTLLATVVGASTTATTTYVHPEHLGGTNVATDENGEMAQTLDYYPYGSQRIASGPFSEQRRFIGEEYDGDTEFSYLNARYYQGSRGQFMSQDPVFWEIGQTKDGRVVLQNFQLQNSYSYAGNNPIGHKDLSGRFVPQSSCGRLRSWWCSRWCLPGFADYQAGQFSGFGAYGAAAGRGAVIGATSVISPFLGAGAVSTLSLSESVARNGGYITAQDGVRAIADGAVTGLTAGFLKGFPQVRGAQATRVFGSTYYTGAHAQRYIQEATFGFGADVYYANVQGYTNAQLATQSRSSSGGGQSSLTSSEFSALKGLFGAFTPGASSQSQI